MNDLDELFTYAPPRDPPPPPIDWAATEAALGVELPGDYKALAEAYGSGSIAGLVLWIPGLPDRDGELLHHVQVERAALRYLIDADVEQPYAPEQLLPWGSDESGNNVWWLMEGDWPVVASEARGPDWERYDSALGMLVGLLSGRLTSDFLVIEGEGFEPYG
jgi:hypothetical protein